MGLFSWHSTLLIQLFLCFSSTWGATTFDDVKESFAEFQRWQPQSSSRGIEGKLEFLFKTHLRDSILLYQDDGIRDYLSVEILSGKVLVSFGVSGNSVRVQIGQRLADMMWHKIVIQLNSDRVTLTLDQNVTQTATIPSHNNALLVTSGYLYIGGVPRSLSISYLSSPQVAFKKRFVGCIKKVMMTNAENALERATLIKSKGTKSGCLNKCRVRNPCLNNGKCVNRFSKAKCDCSGTGFEGKRCEKEILRLRISSEDYLVYDMSSHPQATLRDHINIHFKTSKKNGILLQTSFFQDYVTIKLSNGKIAVEWDLGSGKLELFIGNNLNDDRWHMIDVRRFKRNVKAILDGVYTKESICPPSHSAFNMNGGDGKVFVGGSETVSRKDKFVGCLWQVVFGKLEFISKLKAKDPRFSVVGNKVWSCGAPTAAPLTTVPMTTVPKARRGNPARNRNRQRRKRVSPTAINMKGRSSVVIVMDSYSSKTEIVRVKTTQPTKSTPKRTTCSPNDVRCVLKTNPNDYVETNKKPTKNPNQSSSCHKYKNCTKEVGNTTPPDPPTNVTNTVGKQKQEGLKKSSKELGNVPTAISLVAGSILLFLLCGFISYRFSKRREEKRHSRAHQIKVEVKVEEDEEEKRGNRDSVHQDVLVKN